MTAVEVRQELVRALELDLTGPSDTNNGDPNEVLPQAPSRWYLTGFLAPLEGSKEQRSSEDANEELDLAGEPAGLDDSSAPEAPAARQRFLPSSIGASVIVPESARTLQVAVTWGDYRTSGNPRCGSALRNQARSRLI